jgi:hypothetical protein
MLNLATPGGFDELVPSWPFTVSQPGGRTVVDKDVLRIHGEPKLHTIGQRQALLPVTVICCLSPLRDLRQ